MFRSKAVLTARYQMQKNEKSGSQSSNSRKLQMLEIEIEREVDDTLVTLVTIEEDPLPSTVVSTVVVSRVRQP